MLLSLAEWPRLGKALEVSSILKLLQSLVSWECSLQMALHRDLSLTSEEVYKRFPWESPFLLFSYFNFMKHKA